MEGKEAGAARRERDFAPSLHGGGGICYGVAMSGETENENRRRIEKLEIGRETDKEIQEKNMQILESNMKELLAQNEVAFERLLASFERLQGSFEKLRASMFAAVFGGIVASVTVLGGLAALVEYLSRTP